MASRSRDNFSDRILAVVQGSGQSARILVLSVDPGDVKFLEARTGEGDPAQILESVWSRHGRGRVLRLVPGDGAVCRVGTAATGNEAETVAALSLVGEALLPTDVPPHRRAAGVLPGIGIPSAEARVLATAWVGEAPPPLEPALNQKKRENPESWITPVAALSGVLSGQAMAAHVDAESGTIAVLAAGPQRTVARQLVGDPTSSSAWLSSVESALRESAQAAGLDGASTAILAGYSGKSGFLVTPQMRTLLREKVQGIPSDDHWMNQYGLAAAAGLVASGPATARPLAGLFAEAPKVREPAVLRTAAWLSAGSRPRLILTIAAIILLVGPVGFAFARYSVLKSKSSRLDAQKTTREQTQRQAALYSQLESSRWPVTKLLSDLSVSTPIGVSLDSVNLSTDMGLKIAGKADSQGLVNTLQSNLNATKLFRNVKIGRTASGDDGAVEFDISAEVTSPSYKVANAEDFAKSNLATRLYGPGADNTREAPVTDKSHSRRTAKSGSEDSGKDGAAPSRRGSGDEGPPPPVTDADIAKMNKSEATMAWVKRKTYIQKNPNTDTETKDRLNNEVVKLKEHAAKAPAAGGGK